MAQLRQDFNEFTALDAVILVVGPEEAKTFRSYWSQHGLPFIGLPDPGHTILKLYGQQVKLFKLGRMPAMVVIDKKGVVRYVHYGHSMSDIPENRDVLDTLRELDGEQ
jgi:peroxiredoxin